jgi:hypothetical protein
MVSVKYAGGNAGFWRGNGVAQAVVMAGARENNFYFNGLRRLRGGACHPEQISGATRFGKFLSLLRNCLCSAGREASKPDPSSPLNATRGSGLACAHSASDHNAGLAAGAACGRPAAPADVMIRWLARGVIVKKIYRRMRGKGFLIWGWMRRYAEGYF